MLRATAPGAAGFGTAAIPDDELWPELDPEDFEPGELALEDAGLDEDVSASLAVWDLYDRLWTDGLLVPLEHCRDAGVPLPPELREARLRRFPLELGARLEAVIRSIPSEVLEPCATCHDGDGAAWAGSDARLGFPSPARGPEEAASCAA